MTPEAQAKAIVIKLKKYLSIVQSGKFTEVWLNPDGESSGMILHVFDGKGNPEGYANDVLLQLSLIYTTAIQQARREGLEEAAVIAENTYHHRDPAQTASYRAGDFTLDYEAAGDAITAAIRQRAKE